MRSLYIRANIKLPFLLLNGKGGYGAPFLFCYQQPSLPPFEQNKYIWGGGGVHANPRTPSLYGGALQTGPCFTKLVIKNINFYTLLKSWYFIGWEQFCHRNLVFGSDNKFHEIGPKPILMGGNYHSYYPWLPIPQTDQFHNLNNYENVFKKGGNIYEKSCLLQRPLFRDKLKGGTTKETWRQIQTNMKQDNKKTLCVFVK